MVAVRIRTHVAVRVPQVVLSQGPQPHTAVAIVALQDSKRALLGNAEAIIWSILKAYMIHDMIHDT